MKYSYIAAEIDKEYRLIQAYEKAKRQKCNEKNCKLCKYSDVCLHNNINKDSID